MSNLLPKLAKLTGKEAPHEVEIFKADLLFRLSEDPRFSEFTDEEAYKWGPASEANHGLEDDDPDVQNPRSAAQKSRALELMLGIVASYIPIISRNYIVKQSTSFNDLWARLRVHYDYKKSGSQILDLLSTSYQRPQPSESPEAYWQRLYSFFEDSLLQPYDNILHCGTLIDKTESLQPTLLNVMVVIWLNGIDQRLPQLVQQRFGSDLLTNTLFSLREQISSSLKFLLTMSGSDSDESFIARLNINDHPAKWCCFCDATNRPSGHFLSECKFLRKTDRDYMKKPKGSKTRAVEVEDGTDEQDQPASENASNLPEDFVPINRVLNPPTVTVNRRVGVLAAPVLSACYGPTPVRVTIDSGAESDLIRFSEAKRLKVPLNPTQQAASQADSVTPLQVVGETDFILNVGHHRLQFSGLVVANLSDPIVGGVPFMHRNDLYVRPKSSTTHIGDCCKLQYQPQKTSKTPPTRSVHILRTPTRTTLLPGEAVKVDLPPDFRGETLLAVEPRLQCPSMSRQPAWLEPSIQQICGGVIYLTNSSTEPVVVSKSEQVSNIRRVEDIPVCSAPKIPPTVRRPAPAHSHDAVTIGPSVPSNFRSDFKILHGTDSNQTLFGPGLGLYNGARGRIESVVNTTPDLPPQRKGRTPQYSNSDQVLLQEKFDELLDDGVLAYPEDIGITVEYLNPSFLVKKKHGHRLVSVFGELAKHSKPQPSLLPNVDQTLRTIGQWKYLVKADLRSAYYQIPLSRDSMKYCGVSSPFRGVMVYTRCAMGMPGSETALEQVMTRVLGSLTMTGKVCKIADDLYCGGDTYESVLETWSQVLGALSECGLRLSPAKTEVCPDSCEILGWVWKSGQLSASSHKLSTLESFSQPITARGMRGFTGAYKFLARVLPFCSDILAPLEASVAGLDPKAKVPWTDELEKAFADAKSHLSKSSTITLPRSGDQLQIVTDAAQSVRGLAATMYVIRDGVPYLGGFFNARMKPHQSRWLPCECEALCVGSAVRFFAPYIVQSRHRTTVLTDSKPCVQAYGKLCRGQFSNSARVMTFLSILCNYGVNLQHIRGSNNLIADFTSRNPIDCTEPSCQICKFVNEADDTVVRAININDVTGDRSIDAFTTRRTWHNLQRSCYDLKRTHAHLRQGTVPRRKERQVTDIRRYLNNVKIARDGLLVVPALLPLAGMRERIVVPGKLVHGLVTAIHLKFNHPSKHQLKQIMHRNFFALNMDFVIDTVTSNCDTCKALGNVPTAFKQQSTTEPSPDSVGHKFAIDIMKRARQNILVIREDITSLTLASIVPDERAVTLRNAIIELLSTVHSSSGHPVRVRSDPAPAFRSLVNDDALRRHGIQIELGHEKNRNKNPVAERCIREMHGQLARLQPGGGPVSSTDLALAVNSVNSAIRGQGLSAFELWSQRDQFKGSQLPISDRLLLRNRHEERKSAHQPSAKFKARGRTAPSYPEVSVGDLVYLSSDRDKTKIRDRYLVCEIQFPLCSVRKFHGNQLRSREYTVDLTDCVRISSNIIVKDPASSDEDNYDVSDDDDNGQAPERTIDDNVDYAADNTDSDFSLPESPEVRGNELEGVDDVHSSDAERAAALPPLGPLPRLNAHNPRPRRVRRRPEKLNDFHLDSDLDLNTSDDEA